MSKFYYLRVHSSLQRDGAGRPAIEAIQNAKQLVKELNSGNVSSLETTTLPADRDDNGYLLISIDSILLD